MAVTGTVLLSAGASTAFTASAAYIGGYALTHFLATAAIGLALNALSPKPKLPGRAASRGYDVNSFGSALDHQIIYGRMKTGGAVVYDNSTGTNNKFLHRIIAFAGHEVEAFEEIYINDELVEVGPTVDYTITLNYFSVSSSLRTRVITVVGVPASFTDYSVSDTLTDSELQDLLDVAIDTSGLSQFQSINYASLTSATITTKTTDTNTILSPKYAKSVRINQHLGSPDQLADEDLVAEVPEWTSAHRLRGIAYLYVRLEFDADVFPNGVPQITAVIKGKKVYDPRSDTTVWSDNPALCIRDYLTSTSYGLGEAEANIDDDLVITAANVCDEATATTAKRFTCNGSFTTAVAPYDFLGDILTSMGGLLWYGQGKWRMKPAYYVAPTISLNEDDFRSSVSVSTRHSRRDSFNVVKGTFKGAESNWQITDYPEVTNSAFLTEDNGQESVVDIDLPFTSDSAIARRIALIALERNRQQLTVSASFGLEAFKVQVGDIVNLSSTRFGWTDKEFEVTSWTFGLVDEYDLQVQMTLREISESVFDDISDGVVYSQDNTELLSVFDVPSVGVSAIATTQVIREKLTNIINVNITSGRPEGIDRIEVEFRSSDDEEYTSLGTGELGLYRAVDLDTGDYDFRVRAINTFGIKGEWEYSFNIPANGLLQPPADVTGFTAEVNGSSVYLEWTPVPDLDLSYYVIRHSLEEVGATYANATTAISKVPRPANSVSLPARSGTYHIKAIDKSGVGSENYTSVVVPNAALEEFTTTLTQTEDNTFTGTKTGCSVISNTLRITDPSSGPSTATYDFSDVIDTGAARRVRSRIDVGVARVDNVSSTFDNIPGLFDEIPGLFDDFTGAVQFADTNVKTYISITQDNPAGTPTWTDYQLFKAGDYFGRAFRYRLVMDSTSDNVTPSISSLDAIVEYN